MEKDTKRIIKWTVIAIVINFLIFCGQHLEKPVHVTTPIMAYQADPSSSDLVMSCIPSSAITTSPVPVITTTTATTAGTTISVPTISSWSLNTEGN